MAIEIIRPKPSRGGPWVITQFCLFILYLLLPPFIQFKWSSWMHAGGTLMMGWGLMFFGGGLVSLSKQQGWRNVSAFPKPNPGVPLVTDGAFAYCRHPVYLGVLLEAFGWSIAHDNLSQLVVAAVLVYFFLEKIKREETFLEKTFSEYPAYAAKVKKLLPGVY
jgi:protein-S-isoprenylcysteine O-methyltransferase Ste14